MNTNAPDIKITTMTTLSEVTNILKERGYNENLNLKKDHLECPSQKLKIFPGEFTVDKHYRFEGSSDPADEAIVFAVFSAKHHLKGVLINGYGISSESMTDEMIKALDEKEI